MRGFQRLLVRSGVIGLILLASVSSHAADLIIGEYTLVSSTRISRTVYENTYTARVTNSGPAVVNAQAALTGHGANITVVDGELDFGDVAAGATVTSRDTFKVRHDRVALFDPASLAWAFQTQVAVAVPDVVGSIQVAAETAISLAHLVLGAVTFAENNAVPVGTVLSQDPPPGDVVPEGSAVNLAVAVSANQEPTADAGGPYSGTLGSQIVFTGAESSDPENDPLTYYWEFGDGTTGSGIAPSHTYTTVDSFTVTLTVDDGHGGTSSAAATATIRALSLDVIAGQEEIIIVQGESQSAAFTLQIQNQTGTQAHLNAAEAVSPESGLDLVSDQPPGGWSTDLSNQTFLVQNTFTGNTVGDYAVTLTGFLSVSGQVLQKDATIMVRVVPPGGLGMLSLSFYPGGLQTNSTRDVLFGANYSIGTTIPIAVALDEVTSTGDIIQTVSAMHDNGEDSDLSAGDMTYTAVTTLTAGATPGVRYFRATATFADGTVVQSAVDALAILPYPIGFTTPAESFIVVDPGTSIELYCNQVLVVFKPVTSLDLINAAVNSVNGAIVGVEPSINSYQVSIPCSGMNGVSAAIETLIQNENVESAGPNIINQATEVVPNDPYYFLQWAPAKVRADEAWVIARGRPVIAVIDTGVDSQHPDFSATFTPPPTIPTGPIKVTRQVTLGPDLISGRANAMDDNGHGTHVAGIAAATGNNGVGVAGIAWNTPIVAVKVLNSAGRGNQAVTASGILWAIPRAKILNMSLGSTSFGCFPFLICNPVGSPPSSVGSRAIARANAAGVLSVAAAGNNSNSTPMYPCAYSGVLCVGSSTQNDLRSYFSSFGSWVNIAAPGHGLYSTDLNGSYSTKFGTSMASPVAAGVAALVWSRYPEWTRAQVRSRLIKTGVPLPGQRIGPRVDAFEAVFNGGFEDGLNGWNVGGTGSAMPRLGPISPTQGLKMAMVSTGPDLVTQSDLIQTFTIQSGVTNFVLRFDYAMITEEYPEFVGLGFNDDLEITLEGGSFGLTSLVLESVDGSVFNPIEGIDFPAGDDTVGWTGWRTVSFNIPVTPDGGTFRLRVRDLGDGTFDTNGLIDNIRFK